MKERLEDESLGGKETVWEATAYSRHVMKRGNTGN